LFLAKLRLAEIATKEKVSLADVEEVKRRTIIYLRACEETGTPPSCIGLAHSLGYSDRALRDHRNNQPNSETAQWLEMFNEMCSDVLNQSALNNNVNPLYAMFINKAKYDYVDRKELILTPNNTSNTEDDYSAEDIKKRYLPYAHKEIIEGGADDGTDLL